MPLTDAYVATPQYHRVSFAIVSDLHCRLASDPIDSYLEVGSLRLPPGRSPQQSLLDLIADHGLSVDALLVPGDLTNQACREGLSQSWDIVLEIGRQLQTETVLPVLGNHDVDSRRRYSKSDPFFNIRNLRPHFPFQDDNARVRFLSEGFCILEVTKQTQVIAINTVIDHTDEKTAKRGSFDSSRIDALKRYLLAQPRFPIRVALMHHHPIPHIGPYLTDQDVLETGDALLRVLRESGCKFIVHGHRHVPRLTIHDGVAVFAAGSFAANLGIYASSISNTFHIIDLEENNTHLRGKIRTWVYRHGEGWATADPLRSGFPYLTGFDSRVTLPAVEAAVLLLGNTDHTCRLFDKNTLEQAVPQLPYLSPSDFFGLQQTLQKYNLKLVDPDANGEYELWRQVAK